MLKAENYFRFRSSTLVGIRHPSSIHSCNHCPVRMPYLFRDPHCVFAGGEHYAGISLSRLIGVAIPHASVLQNARPQCLTDRLVAFPAPFQAWISKDFFALPPGVFLLILQRVHAALQQLTLLRPAFVLVLSTAFECWLSARVTIKTPRTKSTSGQSRTLRSDVRKPVQNANCNRLRPWPVD